MLNRGVRFMPVEVSLESGGGVNGTRYALGGERGAGVGARSDLADLKGFVLGHEAGRL